MKSFGQALEIIKLNGNAVKKVAKNRNFTSVAFLFVLISGLAAAIGNSFVAGFDFVAFVTQIISSFASLFIGTGVAFLVALLFGGKARFMELLRPYGFSSILAWLTVIPFILLPIFGWILMFALTVWDFVVSVVILKNVYNFSTGRALAVLLVPIAIFVLLMILAVFILGFGEAFIAKSMDLAPAAVFGNF